MHYERFPQSILSWCQRVSSMSEKTPALLREGKVNQMPEYATTETDRQTDTDREVERERGGGGGAGWNKTAFCTWSSAPLFLQPPVTTGTFSDRHYAKLKTKTKQTNKDEFEPSNNLTGRISLSLPLSLKEMNEQQRKTHTILLLRQYRKRRKSEESIQCLKDGTKCW